MLIDDLQANRDEALKRRDHVRLNTLRFILSELQKKQIDKGAELTDDEVVATIRAEVKKLSDAAETFEKGGRPELANENKSQINILQEFLPEEMDDAELEQAIDALIAQSQTLLRDNPKAIIGIVMSELKSKVDPNRIMPILEKKI